MGLHKTEVRCLIEGGSVKQVVVLVMAMNPRCISDKAATRPSDITQWTNRLGHADPLTAHSTTYCIQLLTTHFGFYTQIRKIIFKLNKL